MSRAAVVSQAWVRRAIRAAKAEGLTVSGVECEPSGAVRVLTREASEAPMNDLDAWRKRGGERAA